MWKMGVKLNLAIILQRKLSKTFFELFMDLKNNSYNYTDTGVGYEYIMAGRWYTYADYYFLPK